MNTNKTFIAYAKEHFDGTPTEYCVDYCDSGCTPQLDVADPNISLDIHIEGNLNDPMQRAQLASFCKQHNIPFAEELSKSIGEDTYYSEDSVLEALELSATEANPFKVVQGAIANKITEHKVNKSGNVINDEALSGVFRRNEEAVEKCMTSREVYESAMTPEQAARYFVGAVVSTGNTSQTLYALTDVTSETGQRVRSAVNVSAGCAQFFNQMSTQHLFEELSNDKQKGLLKKLSIAAMTTVLASIKKAKKGDAVISGYTLTKELGDRFVASAGTAAASYSQLYNNNDIVELTKIWNSAKAESRKAILKEILANMPDNSQANQFVPAEVIGMLSNKGSIFDTIDWKLVLYAIENSQVINQKAFLAISTNGKLQNSLINKGEVIGGLDLSTSTQIGAILIARKCDDQGIRFEDMPKNGTCLQLMKDKGGWKTPEAMEQIAKELVQALEEKPKKKSVYGKAQQEEDDDEEEDSAVSTTEVNAVFNRYKRLPQTTLDAIKGMGDKDLAQLLGVSLPVWMAAKTKIVKAAR